DLLRLLNHRTPPLAAGVLLELHAQRSVVPRRPGATVDVAGGAGEAAPLSDADDGADPVCRQRDPRRPRRSGPAARSVTWYAQAYGQPDAGRTRVAGPAGITGANRRPPAPRWSRPAPAARAAAPAGRPRS